MIFSDFKKKIWSWTGIWILDLALYYLSYPGSIDGTDLKFSLESKAMHFGCETIYHQLTGLLMEDSATDQNALHSIAFKREV